MCVSSSLGSVIDAINVQEPPDPSVAFGEQCRWHRVALRSLYRFRNEVAAFLSFFIDFEQRDLRRPHPGVRTRRPVFCQQRIGVNAGVARRCEVRATIACREGIVVHKSMSGAMPDSRSQLAWTSKCLGSAAPSVQSLNQAPAGQGGQPGRWWTLACSAEGKCSCQSPRGACATAEVRDLGRWRPKF
jgi:hypothetical protein